MRAARPRRHIVKDFAIAPVHIGAMSFVTATPAAQTDNIVVFGPIGKGIVRGMHHHDPAAAAYIVKKSRARLLGPMIACVIKHHHVVFRKRGGETGHVPAFGRACRHVHLE